MFAFDRRDKTKAFLLAQKLVGPLIHGGHDRYGFPTRESPDNTFLPPESFVPYKEAMSNRARTIAFLASYILTNGECTIEYFYDNIPDEGSAKRLFRFFVQVFERDKNNAADANFA